MPTCDEHVYSDISYSEVIDWLITCCKARIYKASLKVDWKSFLLTLLIKTLIIK